MRPKIDGVRSSITYSTLGIHFKNLCVYYCINGDCLPYKIVAPPTFVFTSYGGNAHLLLIQKSLYGEYMPPLGLQPEHITVFQINSSFMIRADIMIRLTYWLLQCNLVYQYLDLWTKLVVSSERRKPCSYPLGSLYIFVSIIRRAALKWF